MLEQLARDGGERRLVRLDEHAARRAALLDDDHHAPVPELREGEAGDARERLVEVDGGRELLGGGREEALARRGADLGRDVLERDDGARHLARAADGAEL